MLLHQLGDDLVLASELVAQGLDGPLLLAHGGVALALEGGGAVLEEGPLPGVEDGGLELVLVAEVGDGDLVDEVTAEDGDLLGGGVVLAGLSHRVVLRSGPMLTLAQENSDSS